MSGAENFNYDQLNIMRNKIKNVVCGNCQFFNRDKAYKTEGLCRKDGEYTREHRVCSKLPSDDDRRDAKIN